MKLLSSLEYVPFFILDDLQSIRNQMVNDLRSVGCKGEITEAESIQDALSKFRNVEIGFVICDWNLPDGSGLNFLKEFRKEKNFLKTPFVMCTTNDEVAHFLEAIQEGASDYIVKPWTSKELISKLNNCWKFVNRT